MRCPACNKAMVVLEYKDVELDFCLDCRGSWLDRGELGLILTGTPDLPGNWQIEQARKGKRACPRCGAKMSEGVLPGTDVEIDTCPQGHGLWFDGGELEAVAQAHASDGAGKAVAAFCADIFGRGERSTSNVEHRTSK